MNVMTASGRTFSHSELKLIREISQRDSINRTQISREVCLALNWLKPDGKLKEMSCRVALYACIAQESSNCPHLYGKIPTNRAIVI
jgi:hypothetical protein